MKKVFVYGTAVLALTAAPLLAQQPGGSSTTDRQGSTPATTQSGSQPAPRSGSSTTQPGAQASSRQAMNPDHAVVMEAAMGGMAEVELGQLASQKAESEAVKQFGQRMVTDHGKANDELKALAQSKNITLQTTLDSKHKATLDRLSKLTGAQFDRAYMQDMVSDHQKDVAAFRKEAQSGKDPEVKAWAAKTLPTLEEHLKMAQTTSKSAVGTSGTRSNNGATGTRGTTPGTRSGSTPGSGSPEPGGSTTPR
jgi:putative membrane protein